MENATPEEKRQRALHRGLLALLILYSPLRRRKKLDGSIEVLAIWRNVEMYRRGAQLGPAAAAVRGSPERLRRAARVGGTRRCAARAARRGGEGSSRGGAARGWGGVGYKYGGHAARRGPRRSRAPRRAAAPRPRRRAARRAPGRVQAVRGGGRGGTRRERRHLIAHHTWRRTRSPRRFDSIDNPFCQSVASSSMKNDHTARRRHARRDSHWPANRTTL